MFNTGNEDSVNCCAYWNLLHSSHKIFTLLSCEYTYVVMNENKVNMKCEERNYRKQKAVALYAMVALGGVDEV
jgi:hypothetical protein